MRKLFAIFAACAVILYGLLFCFADEQISIGKDLPLAMKYETKQGQENLRDFEGKAYFMLAEQQLNLNLLSSIYYMGYAYGGSFDGASLERALSWQDSVTLNAPIYKSEIYNGYFKLRTDKLLKQDGISEAFDYGELCKAARQDFDNYIKSAIKSEADGAKLVILLQERLTDKLVELEPGKRKAALDEIYSLRLPANKALCNDYLYQAFEYGVRAETLDRMLEINKEKLHKLSGLVYVRITAERSGQLWLKDRASQTDAEVTHILNTANEGQSFNGLVVLEELCGQKDSCLVFKDVNDNEYVIDISEALKAISVDDKGLLLLKLDDLLNQSPAKALSQSQPEVGGGKEANQADEKIKVLETAYSSKAAEAQAIVKELNRYSIYLELKNKGITNSFTGRFEADKKSWKAAMDARLSKFGPGGMADFAAYIKQFVLASRSELGQSDKGRMLTARFRNSIAQFKQPDDSSLWITDMLYNLKYMK